MILQNLISPSVNTRTGRSWLLFILAGIFVSTIQAQPLDMELLHGLKPRSIGPAGMSGRVTAIDVVLKNPDIIYAGTASGGLWQSTSGGIAWKPIFDEQPLAAIGAVAVNQAIPDIIWVGTGEGNPRNSQSSGNGVYKSLDGGKTWQHLGLENTRNIHRLLLDPVNPAVAYVAAQGSAWGESAERGIYKTVDGGKTWRKVLFVNNKTGAADLVMDPANPNKLIAAMWEYRRWPWFFKSGGPGSGLYLSYDGGENWEKRTDKDGLPAGELGRIGLAIARNNPAIIYALVEAKKNALYRSDDGGFKWRKVSEKNIGNRPFYYADIYVDPSNENRIYNLFGVVSKSEDGGRTFSTLISWDKVHPDHHAWWIHPDDPDFMIDGNDGGLAITRDRGKTWRFVENLPLAQFYHINVDMEIPYNIYGGMQDNGSWRGPSQTWRSGGIRNSYWEEVSFGDGFDVVPDPADANYGYSMWQGGNLLRYDLLTGQSRYVRPLDPEGSKLRFNWNAGIAADPFDQKALYYGSQYLHKSTDRGETWQTISPDLTGNDPEKQKQLESGGLTLDVTNAENHTTIITISPSPRQQGVIWVGTDDGNLQLTRDGGESWRNVIKNIKGVPPGSWVAQVHASTYDAGEAFVVINNYRRDDWNPYVFRTRDYGESWRPLVAKDQVFGYALSFVQDPVAPRLMFLGTESGLYVSIDEGANWQKWKEGYPTVSTMDMVIHPRDHDLVVGTFGRAAYVFDDIRPLRALAQNGPALLEQPLHLFPVPDAYLASYREAPGTRFAAEGGFSGENRPFGALLTFSISGGEKGNGGAGDAESDSLAEAPAAGKDSIKVEIRNRAGEVIRTFRRTAKTGINRIAWGLERAGVRRPGTPKPTRANAPEPGGALVLPGSYTVRLSYKDYSDSATVRVLMDPRITVPEAEIRRQEALEARMRSNIALATEAADRIREAQKTLQSIAGQLKERKDSSAAAVKEQGKAVGDSLKALRGLILQPDDVQGIYTDPERLDARIWPTMNYISSTWGYSETAANTMLERFEKQLGEVLGRVNGFFGKEWQDYRRMVEEAEISFFKDYEPIE